MGFWKNFVETFMMEGYTVYIAGESYAGYYVPYIADGFLNANDTTYYNLSSILVYDGVYSYDAIGDNIPTAAFVDYWGPLLNLNETFLAQVHNISDTCGYDAFMEEALTFPPKGPIPTPPNAFGDNDDSNNDGYGYGYGYGTRHESWWWTPVSIDIQTYLSKPF